MRPNRCPPPKAKEGIDKDEVEETQAGVHEEVDDMQWLAAVDAAQKVPPIDEGVKAKRHTKPAETKKQVQTPKKRKVDGEDVPIENSLKLIKKIESENIKLTFVKDANHQFSRESDLKLIFKAIDEMISN